MKLNKIFSALLALSLTLSLAACGKKEEAPVEKPAEPVVEQPAETPAEPEAQAPVAAARITHRLPNDQEKRGRPYCMLKTGAPARTRTGR